MKKHLKKSLKLFTKYLKEISEKEINKELNSLNDENYYGLSFREFMKALDKFEKESKKTNLIVY